jgi:hypothetical protein
MGRISERGLPALTFFYSHGASLAHPSKTRKPTGVFLGGFFWRGWNGASFLNATGWGAENTEKVEKHRKILTDRMNRFTGF